MTSTDRRRVAVLGGGVSGLTVAWKLARKGWNVTVLEKESVVGGLARTERIGDCGFDYGPHQLYTDFDDVVDEWKALLGDDLLTRTKEARVRFHGKILRYPLSTGDILGNIPLSLSLRCFADFAWTRLSSRLRRSPDRSFEDWVIHRFGKTLYRIHFGPYTEKVWGIPPNRLTADAAEKRIAVQSLWQVLVKTLFKTPDRYRVQTKIHHSPYQTEFRYPRGGLGQLARRLADAVLAAGGALRTGARVEAVELDRKRVLYAASGRGASLPYDRLVSTIPVDEFPGLCRPGLPPDILEKASRLRFRALCLLHLVVRKPRVSPAHWIYFPEPHLSFQRSTEYSNFSPANAPAGRSSFSLEIPCFPGDERWNASDQDLYDEAMAGLERTGLIRSGDVEDFRVVRTPNAYPLFEVESQRILEELLAYFQEHHRDVLFTGRQARFSYINVDHCMHFANDLAERIDASGQVP